MKKLIYVILGIIIGALLTYYFCPRYCELPQKQAKIIKPKGVISIAEAKALSENWTSYRKAAVDSAAIKQGRSQDDRSSWWSLEDIENYLAYAKHESDSLGYDMTGIRVYLGVYGKNAGQSKKDLTTMFMVPTGKKSHAEASSIGFFMVQSGGDIPGKPLNDGAGGGKGY